MRYHSYIGKHIIPAKPETNSRFKQSQAQPKLKPQSGPPPHSRAACEVSRRIHQRGANQHFIARSFPEVFAPSTTPRQGAVSDTARERLLQERLRAVASRRGYTFV
ncbi:hypothetical protein [Paraburkholderia susongensis]|uniref:hypothetical protein n=1 Tax=Paraburkholderia susongensis TaxID=1515439 RepID=UPI00117EC36C|nr:hypothetical protein [Paraburkholderia susongensis]